MAAGRVGGLPVGLQVVGKVLAGILQLVLVQDHVKQLLQRQTVEVARLPSPAPAPRARHTRSHGPGARGCTTSARVLLLSPYQTGTDCAGEAECE